MTVDVTTAISEIVKKPKSFAELVSISLLGFAFLAVFFGWLFNSDLTTPLILFGVMSITILVLLTSKTLVLIMALLIIGTIVTNEGFLLKVGVLIRGDQSGVQEVLADYRRGTAGDEEGLAEIVAQAVREELGTNAPSATVQRIEEIVSTAQYEQIAQRVARQGAFTPLQMLSAGEGDWQQFVDDFEDLEVFKEDLAFLRREGLAECKGKGPRSCGITDIGRQVQEASRARSRPTEETVTTSPQDE